MHNPNPQPRRQFSLRSLFLLMALIAVTHPIWVRWYEDAVLRSQMVPTNHNGFQKISPFQAISFEDGVVNVGLQEGSFHLLAINGMPTEKLLRISALAFEEDRAEKRFAEDLPAVLNAAGMDGKKSTVELTLRDPESGQRIVMPDVQMTQSNRSAIYRLRE